MGAATQSIATWPAATAKMFTNRAMPDEVLQRQSLSQRIVQFLDAHVGQSFMAADLHAVIDSRASESDAVNSTLSQLKKVGRIKAYIDAAVSNTKFFYTSAKSVNPIYAPVPKTAPKPVAAAVPAPAPAPAPAASEPKLLATADLNAAVMTLIEQRAVSIAEQLAKTMLSEQRKAAHAEMQAAIDQFSSAMSAIAQRYFGE